MAGSATYTWRRGPSGPEWYGISGSVASLPASGETDGTRALVSGRRFLVVAGEWRESGRGPTAALEAAAFSDGAVLQVSAASAPRVPSGNASAPVAVDIPRHSRMSRRERVAEEASE